MNKYNLNKEDIIARLPQDKKIKEYINRNLIFLMVGGSHAYGTNTESSDFDIRGIFVGEKENIIGNNRVDQFEDKTNDITIYELSKAINLISEQNPNMHEILFCDEDNIIFATEEYWNIRKNNQKFISSLARHKYSGYAMSQLKRIKGHSKWLIREQSGEFNKKPEILDFCRIIETDGKTHRDKNHLLSWSQCSFLTKETNTIYKVWILGKFGEILNFNGWVDNDNYTFYFEENIDKHNSKFVGLLFFAKDEFNNSLDNYNAWKHWKENRNKDRHKTEQDYGYDTKHAMHLVRLLRMGYEILSEGIVNVKRPDAKELLQIRNGSWSYEVLIQYTEDMDKRKLEGAYKFTKLPKSVDKNFVNSILIETYKNFWNK